MARAGFYQLTDTLRKYWQGRGDVNTISIGDTFEIDLNKQSIYPLIHTTLETSTIGERSISYNLEVRFLDLVDYSKQDTRTRLEPAYGNNNEQDVFHNMEQIAVETVSYFRRGDGYNTLFRIESDPSLEAIKDAYANGIAGWLMTVSIDVPFDNPIC
jgi:hypothetical protein